MKTELLRRRTKIVATVGPACRSPQGIADLIAAGVNVFRLNFSHGNHAEHTENIERIRSAAAVTKEPIGILADLCGPKVRVGKFQGGSIPLKEGEKVVVTTREVMGEPGLIPSQYQELAKDVRTGDRILLDDGLLELRVDQSEGTEVWCTVLVGGTLKDRKGMNLPGVHVSSPALTEKDREDTHFALSQGVDFLALSFVRRPWDVTGLKKLISEAGRNVPVIAKIEKPEAIDCIDEIISEADGIMVARGDLGVEMAPESVPIIQRNLVERCRLASKPVIVATQMLESMTHSPRPTRAEVSDVSTAVFGGADAVMLSAETASGSYPVRAVQMMDRVARQVETWQWLDGAFGSLTEDDREGHTTPLTLRQAVARSTAQLSRDLRVRAIAVRTQKGTSAGVVSATRPAAPIIAMTMDPAVSRRLNLYWGVVPHVITPEEFVIPQIPARKLVAELKLGNDGEYMLMLSGFGKNEPMVTVLTIG